MENVHTYPKFTPEMKATHKILIPNMAPIHFEMMRAAMEDEGYHVEVLGSGGHAVAQEGLKYVHNDTCYPALLVIGQFINALKSGKYDLDSGCKFRTPAREEAFLVSNPYNYFFMNLVVKNDSGIKSLEDMDGKSIAPIVATDGRAVALADWMEKHPDIKLDFETLAASGAMADEITSVEDGVYDAAYLSAEQANAILDETGYDDLTITDRVDGRDTAFLINKDQTELQEAVNKAIDALTEDGTLSKLTEEFFGEDNFEVAK